VRFLRGATLECHASQTLSNRKSVVEVREPSNSYQVRVLTWCGQVHHQTTGLPGACRSRKTARPAFHGTWIALSRPSSARAGQGGKEHRKSTDRDPDRKRDKVPLTDRLTKVTLHDADIGPENPRQNRQVGRTHSTGLGDLANPASLGRAGLTRECTSMRRWSRIVAVVTLGADRLVGVVWFTRFRRPDRAEAGRQNSRTN